MERNVLVPDRLKFKLNITLLNFRLDSKSGWLTKREQKRCRATFPKLTHPPCACQAPK